MRYFVAAFGLLLTLAFGPAAVAADNGWGNAQMVTAIITRAMGDLCRNQ